MRVGSEPFVELRRAGFAMERERESKSEDGLVDMMARATARGSDIDDVRREAEERPNSRTDRFWVVVVVEEDRH